MPLSDYILRLYVMINDIPEQLVGRFHIKRPRARDLWHLSHRVIRKVLGRTIAVWINVSLGRWPLDLIHDSGRFVVCRDA